MGLKSELAAEIAQAFATDLKDAVKPFKGARSTTSQTEVDWLTNTVITKENAYNYSGNGVFDSYEAIEIDGNTIQVNDVRLICLQGNIKPAIDDTITYKNVNYRIVAISHDPADVTWELQLRGVS